MPKGEKHGLEGIGSKRKDAPYRSEKCDWVKVKTEAWREANKARGDLFIPRSPPRGFPAYRTDPAPKVT
jgi:hypothetical protein